MTTLHRLCLGAGFGAMALLATGLLALPASATPDYAARETLRRTWLGHRLPAHAPVDGQARPRFESVLDLERIEMDIEPTARRILSAEGRIRIEAQLTEGRVGVIPLFALFFEPLEVRLGDAEVDFIHDRGSGELLIPLERPLPAGPVVIDMQVAFDNYCGDPTVCIEREPQQHLAGFGWYPINGEVGLDDPFQVALNLTITDGRVPGGTGRRAEPERDGRRVIWRFETEVPTILPAFTVGPNVLEPGDGFLDITLPPGAPDGRFLQEISRQSLDTYVDLLGDYPFTRLGLSPISDNAGVGLGPQANILLPEVFWYIPPDAEEAEVVAQVVSHEIAHQYFFNLVNIHDAGEGWMSEGFAEYAATRVSEARTGNRDHARLNYWNYMLSVDRRQDVALGSEQVDRAEPRVRQAIIYFKGASLLQQLRDRYPDFDGNMRDWVAENAGEIVTTEDFAVFMGIRAGLGAGAFVRQWAFTPGYPVLTFQVERPRDGADQMSVSITQDNTGFQGNIPLVAHFEDGGTEGFELGIGRGGIAETIDLGRAQWFELDPDLTMFRRAVTDPPGDANLSGVVDGMDLLDVLAQDGLAPPTPDWRDLLDVDRNLRVDRGDARVIVDNWGAGW